MDEPPKKKTRRTIAEWVAIGTIALVLIAVSGLLLSIYTGQTKFELRMVDYADEASASGVDNSALARFATGPLAALETPATLAVAPDYVFETRDGADARLADFRGQVVVVNLWATWCAPCLAEMPTLATLARAHAGRDDLLVLPISVDVPAQRARAEAFIAGQAPLPFYNDPTFQLPFEFGARGGMPQTILLDRQGRVRATLTGGADWSGPEAGALIEALLAEDA